MSGSGASPALNWFNDLPAEDAESLLIRCVAVARWARELAAARPFADHGGLLAASDDLTAGLSDDEVLAALADHPKIGDRPAPQSSTASWSASEQSNVDAQDPELQTALREANIAYEQRFGFIYLVCATGRSGHELLADLSARLGNDPGSELAVVRRELGKIARIRLTRLQVEGATV